VLGEVEKREVVFTWGGWKITCKKCPKACRKKLACPTVKYPVSGHCAQVLREYMLREKKCHIAGSKV
jgi:hypothetical protein